MEAQAPATGGLFGSIRGLADGLLGAAHERLELLTLELHEEKFRLVQILIWTSAAVFSAMLAITFASLTVIVVFWDSARVPVLVGFTLLYAGAFVIILRYYRAFIARQPRPFQGTLAELQHDRSCIRPQS